MFGDVKKCATQALIQISLWNREAGKAIAVIFHHVQFWFFPNDAFDVNARRCEVHQQPQIHLKKLQVVDNLSVIFSRKLGSVRQNFQFQNNLIPGDDIRLEDMDFDASMGQRSARFREYRDSISLKRSLQRVVVDVFGPSRLQLISNGKDVFA